MSNPSEIRLRAPVRAVNIPTLDILAPLALPNPPKPAQTRQNPPQSASSAILQNEPTAPPPSSIFHPQSAPPHPLPPSRSVPNFQTNPPRLSHPPAKTRHNPPEPATPTAKLQNEATADLTPRQRHAARLLIAGHTATAVAALLDVDRHTVSDWKKLPAFQAELTRLLNDLAPPPPARGWR